MQPQPTFEGDADRTAAHLLEIIGTLARESRLQQDTLPAVDLDSRFEADLGLDSLARTELLLRLERGFHISLSEQALTAETPRDLLPYVLTASGVSDAVDHARRVNYRAPAALIAPPDQAETVLDVLDWYRQADPDRIYLHVYEESDRARELSYRDLYQGARAVAVALREKGLHPRQAVAIMLPTGSEYFFSFFGILLAGGVPVPIYPPVRPSQIEDHLRRHRRILGSAEARILITIPAAKPVARLLRAQVPEMRHVVTLADLQGSADSWISPRLDSRDTAFLQYTSGSTGDPKGVILSHANLLANLRAMGERIAGSSRDVFVSWLPLYHDMGLIGACLGSLYYGFPLAVMSPLSFLAKPSRWLWAIHQHRGTLSAAPNFAYELCIRNIDDSEIEGLDLSSWRMALNGAEPVNVDTLERFCQRFEPYGFRREALAPVYGLAECSVGLTLHPPDRGPVIDRIQREVFMDSGQAIPAPPGDAAVLRFPACGQPLPGHRVRIVDDQGRELPERQEGRLEFQGPSATRGYLRNPEATRKLFRGDWLDSGDRAYIAGGDVYLTGRVKDLIIRGGRNIYPYELEEAVGEIEGIRKGCVAVVACADRQSGTEKLVVVAETREKRPQIREQLHQRILEISVERLALPPDEVVLAPPHSVLKTSSGKIRRAAVRDLYERGVLGKQVAALWWQLLRVAGASVVPQVRRFRRRCGQTLYSVYAWSLVALLAPWVWLAVLVLPRRGARWAFARAMGRLWQRLTATEFTVRGVENLPPDRAFVLVANHSSYLDSYVVTLAIPRDLVYVAKQELRKSALLRRPLERLGTLFVERFDLQRSAADAGRLVRAMGARGVLVSFPEGTFDRMPGLLPFRTGAFAAAVQARVPVVPVTLRGTRSMLRSGSWFFRRGSVEVIIGSPIHAEGDDWSAAVRLREQARAEILRWCGEPDLRDETGAVFRRS